MNALPLQTCENTRIIVDCKKHYLVLEIGKINKDDTQ